MGVLARLLGAALGLWIADQVLVGVEIEGWTALAAGAGVLGGAHLVLRPVLQLLTFPITVLTLGLSLWVINAALLFGAAWVVPGVAVRGVVPALLGAGVISVVAGLVQALVGSSEDPADG